jgi:hypothetical protein
MLLTGGRDGFGVHSLEYYKRAYALLHQSIWANSWLLSTEVNRWPHYLSPEMEIELLSLRRFNDENATNATYLLQWEAMNGQKHMVAKNMISGVYG